MAGRPKRVIYPAGAQAASAERLAAVALKTAAAAELVAASSVKEIVARLKDRYPEIAAVKRKTAMVQFLRQNEEALKALAEES
ncbi:MAG: hypothetical protein KIC91_00900 [Sutterella sp.]|nr:hypothetical protein [Sutterella sp.]